MKGKFLSPRGIAQFPVTSAYSMTFSTSKGQSFDRSGIYLLEPVYGCGQLYTELKRKEISKFKIYITHKQYRRQIFTCSNTYEKFSKRIVELLQQHLTSRFDGLCVSFVCQKEGTRVCSKHNE